MQVRTRRVSIRLSLAAVLVLALLLTACSTPVAGSATPAPQATTASTAAATTGSTATVQPPAGQPTTSDYPGMPATPVITVTIEAYPTP